MCRQRKSRQPPIYAGAVTAGIMSALWTWAGEVWPATSGGLRQMTEHDEQAGLTVHRPDGRVLDVLTIGPAGGLPLVFHHGTPGGIASYGPMTSAAAGRGLRIVLYARPGYGGSTAQPGRLVADAAGDVAAILDQLGARQFVTVGWSGGGPHALACARLLAGRCTAAATLASVAPYAADGLDWLAGMAQDNVSEFTATLAGEDELTTLLTEVAPLMTELTGESMAEGIGDLASPTDKQALRDGLGDYVADMFRTGLRPGIAGWRDDDLAFVRDWGFPLGAQGEMAPVSLWQGDEDRMVPYAHGQWLAARIPATRTHFSHGTGHMNVPFADVFDELLDLAGGR
jgi:pimeloyl-ACP methyl ester carboxylesterase